MKTISFITSVYFYRCCQYHCFIYKGWLINKWTDWSTDKQCASFVYCSRPNGSQPSLRHCLWYLQAVIFVCIKFCICSLSGRCLTNCIKNAKWYGESYCETQRVLKKNSRRLGKSVYHTLRSLIGLSSVQQEVGEVWRRLNPCVHLKRLCAEYLCNCQISLLTTFKTRRK